MNETIVSNNRLYSLDGLKGFSAFIIAFMWHYQHFIPLDTAPFYRLFKMFYEYGYLMVEVFFMLSGFGIALGYEEKIQKDELSFGEYIKKRLKRLFPTMLLTLFITTLFQLIYNAKSGYTFVYPNFDVYHFLLNLFGLQNGILEVGWSFNAPSWCISILFCCYIVFFYVCKSKHQETLIFRYIVIALGGAVVIVAQMNLPIFNSLLGRGFSCFFIGTCLAKIYQNRSNLCTKRIGYLCFLFLAVVVLLVIHNGYTVLGNIYMTMILGIAPTLILSILFIPWLEHIFKLKPLVHLGKHSLSIYLWHFPVQCFWKIIDVYGNLEIDFSRNYIWIMYMISVLIVAAVYDRFLSNKITDATAKMFLKKY